LERVPKPRQRWSLAGEAFGALLDRLSSDREQAALQFEEHRRYLITLLTYAGAGDPEHLADTTLDRAAKRLAGGEAIDNLHAWLRGAARMVLMESQTEIRREANAAAAAAQSVEELQTKSEADHVFLDECLAALTPENRSLIERYYRPRGKSLMEARKHLAVEFGISSENLRTRALRLRKALEECLRKRRDRAGEE
jgi:DNA-directed RNA polymerase specialized sigma24 family protein